MQFLFIFLFTYFVSFIDKPEKSAPELSERAREQRERWGIQTDAMDYPVSPMYMNRLLKMGVTIYHKSRWFNGVTCEMDEALAQEVRELPFVTNVEMTRDNSSPIYAAPRRSKGFVTEATEVNAEPGMKTDAQLQLLNLPMLHEEGFEGKGILMAICDGGFQNAQTMSCFRQKELELGHFDFTDDTDDFYGYTGAHGSECLSTISGLIKDSYCGTATQAQYYLMRSEEVDNNRESPKEMDNLVAALEKADSLGVNVFSVSLGYYKFDHLSWSLQKSDLDGRHTRASLAATIAARKGMLVCVAAGNEGENEWQKICSPADADSILTVGAVNTEGVIGGFSSYGPSADGRVKPDVCAVGEQATLITPSGQIVTNNGTSFAAPQIAGLAASLWSALPKENAMQIRERIIRSADRYDNPDYSRYGYGIPDAWKAYTMELPTDLDAIENTPSETESHKILHNGQLYILRNGRTYSVSGLEIVSPY